MPLLNSSAVKRAEYDLTSKRMQLWFPDGGPYDFCGVPQSVFDGLVNASSHGSYYNDHIRDRYQCF